MGNAPPPIMFRYQGSFPSPHPPTNPPRGWKKHCGRDRQTSVARLTRRLNAPKERGRAQFYGGRTDPKGFGVAWGSVDFIRRIDSGEFLSGRGSKQHRGAQRKRLRGYRSRDHSPATSTRVTLELGKRNLRRRTEQPRNSR